MTGTPVNEDLTPYAANGNTVNAGSQDVAGEGRAEGVLDSTHGGMDGNNLASGATGMREADSLRHGQATGGPIRRVLGASCTPEEAHRGMAGTNPGDEEPRWPLPVDNY